MNRRYLNRRSFLKGTALVAAAGTVPSFTILGAGVSPNEQLTIAHIGLGKRASQQIVKHWNNDLMAPHCRSVAFADPWDDAGLQSWAIPYAQEVRKNYSHVPRFKDFRTMFDEMGKHIDAVAISGVTNMHYPAGMYSMQAGTHVFMQKPLCLTVEECRKLKETAEKNQLTSGWDSGDASSHCTYRNVLDSGVLGDVTEMHVSLGGGHTGGKPYPDGDHEVPDTISWDVWLNVAAERPYVRNVVRWFGTCRAI